MFIGSIRYLVGFSLSSSCFLLSAAAPMAQDLDCISMMKQAESDVNAVLAQAEASPSMATKCELLAKALTVQITFLTACPEADPTGQDRANMEFTRQEALSCAEAL